MEFSFASVESHEVASRQYVLDKPGEALQRFVNLLDGDHAEPEVLSARSINEILNGGALVVLQLLLFLEDYIIQNISRYCTYIERGRAKCMLLLEKDT